MEIKCVYENVNWDQLGILYTCKITSSSITEPNEEIKDIIGQHKAGKTDRNVEAIWFFETKVHYMPRGLNKIFPNLRRVSVQYCELKEFTREDLVGLENIEALFLNNNKLTSLPDDLFEGMKKLDWISFTNNKLEFVSSQLLQPVLDQLTLVSFLNNATIDAAFSASRVNPSGSYVHLSGLMKLVDEKCKKPPKVENPIKPSTSGVTSGESLGMFKDNLLRGFKNLWTSGHLSDFTIIVGDRKFPVNKTILSIQSEFFDETFKKTEENSVAEMKIEDLSIEVVEEVLRWIYTGQVPDVKNAMEVFALAIKLKISGLKKIAENLVLQQINQENAMEVFELGQRYESEKIKDLAFKEIKKVLNEPNLNENLKNEPENLKKLVLVKKTYEELLKKLNKN